MATITKCDKCDKIIKKDEASLNLMAWGCIELRKKGNLDDKITFCQKCAVGVIKSLNDLTKKL